ncbi:tetratricopeptide repeat protein [Algoriphagus sp. AK58]|uniref:tetratricopeptide repeat protein n=1 Tax=Algoriphagus sp. AK58 TaxID=1406877 RepID=UPI00164FED94|nr:tetratricopeptide repeat protein [Algoriphagus sp. AK58]MBC6367815.1 enzyme of heme biosynthesis [Algoriphagus sp. AK58]
MSYLDRIQLLKNYILEEPDNPFNYYALGLEIKEKDPEEASRMFDYVLENFPNYLPVYFPSAHFFFEHNQWEKARQIFEKGIEIASVQNEEKAKKELKNAYQNFLFETDMD